MRPVPDAMSKLVKLLIVRTPEGISTVNGGKLLNLVNRYKGDTKSQEFLEAWDALCTEKYGRICELVGVSYAD